MTYTFPPISDLAAWLAAKFQTPPKEYEDGRQELAQAIMQRLDCSDGDAERLLDDLERAGHLRYAAEARSVGGGPGTWILYPSPNENPDVA